MNNGFFSTVLPVIHLAMNKNTRLCHLNIMYMNHHMFQVIKLLLFLLLCSWNTFFTCENRSNCSKTEFGTSFIVHDFITFHFIVINCEFQMEQYTWKRNKLLPTDKKPKHSFSLIIIC